MQVSSFLQLLQNYSVSGLVLCLSEDVISQTWNLRYFTVTCTVKNKEILLHKVLINFFH